MDISITGKGSSPTSAKFKLVCKPCREYFETNSLPTDFLRYYEPIVQIAQARLQTLQERLGNSPSNNRGMQLHRSFDDYLMDQRQKGIDRKLQNTTPNSAITQAVTPKTTGDVPNPGKQPTESREVAITADQAKATIASLADKQAQIEHFASLPASIQEELKPWLKQRKVDEKAKQQAEMDNLF